MKPLLIKELRQLLPIAWLWLATFALYFLTELSTRRMDEVSFESWCAEYCESGLNMDTAVAAIFFPLIIAYSLFPREHDEQTIEFLKALPVSASGIFWTKFAAAWLMLCSLIVGSQALGALLISFNPGSVTGKSYPQVDATLLLRDCLIGFIFLSHGLFLSWFRTLGLVLYAAYLVGLLWLDSKVGDAGLFNVFEVLRNEYDGNKLQIQWQALLVHVGVGAGLLLASFVLWCRVETRAKGSGDSTRSSRWLGAFAWTIGFLAVAGILIGAMSGDAGMGLREDVLTSETQHYRLVYHKRLQDRAQQLRTTADNDYDALVALLGAKERPTIHTDLTSENEHAAGLSKWRSIRMDLSRVATPETFRRTLSHETAHVFQAVESGRAMSRNFNSARFFIEGMAHYAAFNIVPGRREREHNWHVAAVTVKRQKIRFNDLADDKAFSEAFYWGNYYMLGDIWTDALVKACGTQAPGRVLRASGRDQAPAGLHGEQFWRDTMQHIGCELEKVNAIWLAQLDSIHRREGDADFPRFDHVSLHREPESDSIMINAAVHVATGGRLPDQYFVRVAKDKSLSGGFDEIFYGRRAGDSTAPRVEFLVPVDAITGKQFRYQLGYQPAGMNAQYSDRWLSGRMPQ